MPKVSSPLSNIIEKKHLYSRAWAKFGFSARMSGDDSSKRRSGFASCFQCTATYSLQSNGSDNVKHLLGHICPKSVASSTDHREGRLDWRMFWKSFSTAVKSLFYPSFLDLGGQRLSGSKISRQSGSCRSLVNFYHNVEQHSSFRGWISRACRLDIDPSSTVGLPLLMFWPATRPISKEQFFECHRSICGHETRIDFVLISAVVSTKRRGEPLTVFYK